MMSIRGTALCVLIPALLGCASQPAPATRRAVADAPPDERSERAPVPDDPSEGASPARARAGYGLCALYELASGSLDYPLHEHARRRFDEGAVLFEAGRRGEAARVFRDVAELLRASAAPELLRNRRIAYANMVISWLDAGEVEAARGALRELAERDAALSRELNAVALALPDPPACELT